MYADISQILPHNVNSLVSSTSLSGHSSHACTNVFLALSKSSNTFPFAELLDCAGGD